MHLAAASAAHRARQAENAAIAKAGLPSRGRSADRDAVAGRGMTSPAKTFIGGSPMKVRDEEIGRALLDLVRRAELLQLALLHDRDAVGQRIGLGLVVGDEDRRQSVLRDQIVLDAAPRRIARNCGSSWPIGSSSSIELGVGGPARAPARRAAAGRPRSSDG